MLSSIQIATLPIASLPAHSAPPPDSTGQFHEWFRSLTAPGSPGIRCSTAADCRMVASRWNDQTSHFEASVVRDLFAKALGSSASGGNDSEVHDEARYVWMWNWINKSGDKSQVWIEIPDAKISNVANPHGSLGAVLVGISPGLQWSALLHSVSANMIDDRNVPIPLYAGNFMSGWELSGDAPTAYSRFILNFMKSWTNDLILRRIVVMVVACRMSRAARVSSRSV